MFRFDDGSGIWNGLRTEAMGRGNGRPKIQKPAHNLASGSCNRWQSFNPVFRIGHSHGLVPRQVQCTEVAYEEL